MNDVLNKLADVERGFGESIVWAFVSPCIDCVHMLPENVTPLPTGVIYHFL